MDGHVACLDLYLLACARAIIGALAIHFDSRIGRGDLFDLACEVLQNCRNRRHWRTPVRSFDNLSFGVERISLFAKLDRKFIDLARIEHPSRQLGRFAQCNRQNTFGQRV